MDWLVEANVSGKHAGSIFTSAVKVEQHSIPKCWLLPTNPHSILTQKIIIRIVTAMKILNLTSLPLVGEQLLSKVLSLLKCTD
jgi:alpha-galactosidase/6-phospho-beta-glucosidase family protein